MRLIAIQPPLSAPYFCIASSAYSEHVGVNLHAGGKRGLIKRL